MNDYDDVDAGGDDNEDVGGCPSPLRPVGHGGAVEKMDRMKIIKRRLSMSLRSARPVDDSLSELAEQMSLDEPSAARENGETREQVHLHTGIHKHLIWRHHTCMRGPISNFAADTKTSETFSGITLYYYICILHVNTASQLITEETEESF